MTLYELLSCFIYKSTMAFHISNISDNLDDYYTLYELKPYFQYKVIDFEFNSRLNKLFIIISN